MATKLIIKKIDQTHGRKLTAQGILERSFFGWFKRVNLVELSIYFHNNSYYFDIIGSRYGLTTGQSIVDSNVWLKELILKTVLDPKHLKVGTYQ